MIKYKITLQNEKIVEVVGYELVIKDGLVQILHYDEEGLDYIIFMCRLSDVYTVVGDVINEP